MMRAVDKNIKVLAAATTTVDWTAPLLKEAGQYLDYISIHGYWDPLWQVNKPSNYLQCIMRSGEPEQEILEAEALLETTGFKGRIKIAFDKWNLRGWHHPGFPGGGADPALIARRAENDRNETYTMADVCGLTGAERACGTSIERRPQALRSGSDQPPSGPASGLPSESKRTAARCGGQGAAARR